MQAMLINYFIVYGYLAVFAVVLLQELGMPGLPNELVLLYFGYLSRQAGLSFPLVIALVVVADMLGSVILYLLFYYGRNWLMQIKPKWVRLPEKKVSSLKRKMASGRGRPLFIAKLTPFVRSYIPVVAGLLQIEPVLYGRVILFTAMIWSGRWVTAGWLLYF